SRTSTACPGWSRTASATTPAPSGRSKARAGFSGTIRPTTRRSPTPTTSGGCSPDPRRGRPGGGWAADGTPAGALLEQGELDLLSGDELEEGRGALLGLPYRAPDRRDDLPRVADPLPVRPEGLGQGRVVSGDVGAPVLLGRHRHDGQLDRHAGVVQQDGQDRDALPHRGFEVHAGEPDRRIPPHVDAQLPGRLELGPHRQPQAVPELGRLAPPDVREGYLGLPERRELVARAP